MLQNQRFSTGLAQYRQHISIFDTSATSDKFFRLFDVPDKLYTGKNSFRIRANMDNLVRGSLVYIEIVDSAGNTIYHEVADFLGEDKSRLIIAYVYQNTTPGEATIYIAGRTFRDPRTGQHIPYSNRPGDSNFKDVPNVMWMKPVVVVPTQQNNDEVLFAKAPLVSSIERFEFFNNYSGSVDRRIVQSGSLALKLLATTDDYRYSNTAKYATKYHEDGDNTILDPKTSDGKIISNQELLPLYSDRSTIQATVGTFTSDMVGGELIIRDVQTAVGAPAEDFQDFSCSIINVIDSTRAQISPGFKRIGADGTVYKSLSNATNVTMSYFSSTPNLVTVDSESFVQLEFEDLEPLAGSVESVRISYKPYGSFGEFINVGDFPINEQNYLVDTTDLVTTKTDLKERPIGKFSSSADFMTYWEIISGSNSGSQHNTDVLDTGRLFSGSGALDFSDQYQYYIKLKNEYSIPVIKGTEFKLSLSVNFEKKSDASKPNQLDIHISGSGIQRNILHDWDTQSPLKIYGLGTMVGTITETGTGQTRKYDFYFRVANTANISPILIVRNAEKVHIKDITISPRNELGYSPNQAKLFIPIETLKTNTELVMNIDYLSATGVKSKISSQLYGLVFSGQGLPKTALPDGIISGSDQLDLSQIKSGSVSASISPVDGFKVNATSSFNADMFISGGVVIQKAVPNGTAILTVGNPDVQYGIIRVAARYGTPNEGYVDLMCDNNGKLRMAPKQTTKEATFSFAFFNFQDSQTSNRVRIDDGNITEVNQITASFISGDGSALTNISSSYTPWSTIPDVPENIVSSSKQIETDISGAFTENSSSFETRVTGLEQYSSSYSPTVDWPEITSKPDRLVSGSEQINGASIENNSIIINESTASLGGSVSIPTTHKNSIVEVGSEYTLNTTEVANSLILIVSAGGALQVKLPDINSANLSGSVEVVIKCADAGPGASVIPYNAFQYIDQSRTNVSMSSGDYLRLHRDAANSRWWITSMG